MAIPVEYQYLAALVAVLLIPKILLRFRIPSGITCLALGCISVNFLGWFEQDQLILMLARLGITSLFLFAGMEIEIDDLRKNIQPLLKHLTKSLVTVFLTAWALQHTIDVTFQIGLIISVAIFTPSAGFILSSLNSYNFSEKEVHWIKLKAISKEIAALAVLFLALQLDDIEGLIKTQFILIAMIIILPFVFKYFLKLVAPFAPKSEVSFLIIIAFASGILTKKLGTHYLLGAFITGVIAGQFNHFMKSKDSERIIESLTVFFSIFVPFYFFKAGLMLTKDFVNTEGLLLGFLFLLIFIPVRLSSVVISLRYFVEEVFERRMTISLALLPNLIFGLVIVNILKETFEVEPYILTALVFYTLIASILPALFFKQTPPESLDLSRTSFKAES